MYQRIDKRVARRLYNDGKTVYIVPCNVYPNNGNPWIKPFELNKKRIDDDFDSRVNDFEYYNCNSELGYYTAFYIEEVDK